MSSLHTILLIGVFLLISWVVRLVVYRDLSKRHEQVAERERNNSQSNESGEGKSEV